MSKHSNHNADIVNSNNTNLKHNNVTYKKAQDNKANQCNPNNKGKK